LLLKNTSNLSHKLIGLDNLIYFDVLFISSKNLRPKIMTNLFSIFDPNVQ